MLSSHIFLCSISFFIMKNIVLATNAENQRHKRFLIFPRLSSTIYQFIGSIGIPADLSFESLTMSYLLKASYFLPYNATEFRKNPFVGEYRADDKSYYFQQRKIIKNDEESPLRWAIYKFIADRLQSYGYNGHECMFKAICEARALSFERHHNIFAELMHIFLSPSISKDLNSELTVDYFEAEKLGRKGKESCEIYNCKFSLINLVSKIF